MDINNFSPTSKLFIINLYRSFDSLDILSFDFFFFNGKWQLNRYIEVIQLNRERKSRRTDFFFSFGEIIITCC